MKRIGIPLLVIGLIVGMMLAACGGNGKSVPEVTGVGNEATAVMYGPDGEDMGTVALTQGPNGVLVSAVVIGLSPGGHGFHIHEVGSCSPDFGAAGDHANPSMVGHGFMDSGGFHAGDLPNIFAAADGTARADFFTADMTLGADADHSIFDGDGSAIIIHAKPDSYGELPGAGDRVACGVIVRN